MPEEVTIEESKKKHHWVLILISIFALVLAFLVYTSFFNPELGKSLTGNVIGNKEVINGVQIEANLNSPENFKTNSKIDKLDLKITGNFIVGNQNFELEQSSVVIDNFDGSVSFDNEKIIINGKANKVFVEGIPISGKLKVNFDNKYSYIKLSNFYLASLNYISTGIVKFQEAKIVANLEGDQFSIKRFQGDLEKRGDNFKLKGIVEEAKAGLTNIKYEDIAN